MKTGTWNVRSLFWSGALKVLHNELSKLDFDVVALQETRLESGIQKFDNFALFNSGLESKKHEFGCSFYVSGELGGPDIGSDHNLLKMNFKVKLRVKIGNKYNEKRKMVNIFQNPKWKQEYAIEINSMFEILENLDDEDSIDNNINEKWENITTIIKVIKQQLIEKGEGCETFKNKQYDEECKFAIEEMKKAREKWLKNEEGRRKSMSITTKEKKLTK